MSCELKGGDCVLYLAIKLKLMLFVCLFVWEKIHLDQVGEEKRRFLAFICKFFILKRAIKKCDIK